MTMQKKVKRANRVQTYNNVGHLWGQLYMQTSIIRLDDGN